MTTNSDIQAASSDRSEPTTGAPVAEPEPVWSEDWLAVAIGAFVIAVALILAPALTAWGFKLPSYSWSDLGELGSKVLSFTNLARALAVGGVLWLLAIAGNRLLGTAVNSSLRGFPVLYAVALVSMILASNADINRLGLEYVIWALALGLTLGNTLHLPVWLTDVCRSEFYIKTGIVILGVSVLFHEIVKAGLPGILQALVVVLVVWFFAFWLAKRVRVDDEFAAILSTAVSICGVSAAIAACGALKGDRTKLSYTTTLVVLVAVPMLVLMPWVIRTFDINEVVGGAWLGGTLDTTASVAAAGQLVSPAATKTGVIVKFTQNILLGLAAFCLAIWWTVRHPNATQATSMDEPERPSARVIWQRFPKFVLGFVAASLLFSFAISAEHAAKVAPLLNGVRTLWFALAFASIGLEARFVSLLKLDGGRPALAFIGAQVFNVAFTLLMAYLLFGGILLPAPAVQ